MRMSPRQPPIVVSDARELELSLILAKEIDPITLYGGAIAVRFQRLRATIASNLLRAEAVSPAIPDVGILFALQMDGIRLSRLASLLLKQHRKAEK
jgi:hypothetical protein